MAVTFDFRKAMEAACDLAILALQEELDNQNHNATGALSKEIKSKVTTFPDGAKGVISTYLYGGAVNFGVPASRFRFGGKKHINKLIKWIGDKGITPNKGTVKNFAWAIAKKHAKEGIPTRESYKFSRNGKRLGFMTDALTVAETSIQNLVPVNVQINITFEL